MGSPYDIIKKLALGGREQQVSFVPRTHRKDCAMQDVEEWGWRGNHSVTLRIEGYQ